MTERAFFRKNKKPSLDTINQLLDKLNRPDKSPNHRVIIGGTALKGTTCYHIESVLQSNGLSTTLITSPHLEKINERIRINSQEISDNSLNQLLEQIEETCQTHNIQPTFYEAMIATGILASHKNNSEVLILEVGLGGNFDAVNAVQGPRISGLSFIGNDHAQIIGPTLKDVATEKAGIFTKSCTNAYTCEHEYYETIQEIAKTEVQQLPNQNIPKQLTYSICSDILQTQNFQIPKLQLPCRWEKIQNFILDGAHSEPRFKSLIPKLQNLPQKPDAIIAMTSRHDYKSLKHIIPYLNNITWTTIPDQDHWEPTKLQEYFQKGTVNPNPLNSVSQLSDLTLITGSFYLCGYIRKSIKSL
jgi:folylpolyglutamate synthase/dihydropteroate synthase